MGLSDETGPVGVLTSFGLPLRTVALLTTPESELLCSADTFMFFSDLWLGLVYIKELRI